MRGKEACKSWKIKGVVMFTWVDSVSRVLEEAPGIGIDSVLGTVLRRLVARVHCY